MAQSEKRGKSASAAQSAGLSVSRKRKAGAAAAVRQSAPLNESDDTEAATVVLNADMRVSAAKELYAKLIASKGQGALVLVADGVVRVDAAGIQALCAALNQISNSGGSWRWHNPSTSLTHGIELLGLKALLRLP